MITGNPNVVPDYRIPYIISKGPKYRFPSNIDFPNCRREIAASLNDFSNRWCKRENVEHDALRERKLKLLIIVISLYFRNIHIYTPPPPSPRTKN